MPALVRDVDDLALEALGVDFETILDVVLLRREGNDGNKEAGKPAGV